MGQQIGADHGRDEHVAGFGCAATAGAGFAAGIKGCGLGLGLGGTGHGFGPAWQPEGGMEWLETGMEGVPAPMFHKHTSGYYP